MTEGSQVANSPLFVNHSEIKGEFVSIEGEDFFRISNYDRMRPFFMTLVSHSDHWLFISSTGGLSAGRKNEDYALFPYYTDDKISESSDLSGTKSIFRVKKSDKSYLWEPFSDKYEGLYRINRNIFKNIWGNKIIFEETNQDLELRFRYSWQFSEKYGFIRKSELENISDSDLEIELLDGLQNILPFGVKGSLQNERSNLVNAYKKSELDKETGLGMILLSAIIVDKAEPSEALKANTVWSSGLKVKKYLLSSLQLKNFRFSEDIKEEVEVKAEPGAYLINADLHLKSGEKHKWQIVAEVNQDAADVNNLILDLKNDKENLLEDLDKDIERGTQNLRQLVGAADGLQKSQDKLIDTRHYANVLFNIMRGGIFDNGYTIEASDFRQYLHQVNRELESKHSKFLDELPNHISHEELTQKSMASGDVDLVRLCFDYLPLTFSRRHGDPSRPWNKFSIETKKEDGSRNLNYQGNWRDIFQNWEALAYSYPGFINSMISKFLNASSIDGYNPYRITRSGVDWEVIEPDDPWSYIGYWGDHQIIYLLKLLEIAQRHSGKELQQLLDKSYFVYANVPYRIRSYREILNNPKDTIDFEIDKEKEIEKRVEEIGSDGKMVFGSNKEVLRASLNEKLLLTLLTKFSNFIPEAGIWLNTQRPEWNDANNALVGNGVSMVTLYYMRRYVQFCIGLYSESSDNEFSISLPIHDFLKDIFKCFSEYHSLLTNPIDDLSRRNIMDRLGMAGEKYRERAYKAFDSEGSDKIDRKEIIDFLKIGLEYIDHSIRANKREDGFYHSYNLISLDKDSARISYLYEMLEGQVAVLTSGYLNSDEVSKLLDVLKSSKIFREDQYSYLLYPDRKLPRFLEKNNIPESFIKNSQLAQKLIEKGDRFVILEDNSGGYHFNGNFTNAAVLNEALNELGKRGYKELVESERQSFLDIYEKLFNHKAFTGRSGTFFGYEGLGSIYWHMVSKLLLSIQENIEWAREEKSDSLKNLIDHYYEVREGIGAHKSPDLYGAFPTDAYSHTPANKGAQQPGMTGQVKEDIINRWAELGVNVEDGELHFSPTFLRGEELLEKASRFEYFDVNQQLQNLDLKEKELAFTYCQVPVVYKAEAGNCYITIRGEDGEETRVDGHKLSRELSSEVFGRTGRIRLIRVALPLRKP